MPTEIRTGDPPPTNPQPHPMSYTFTHYSNILGTLYLTHHLLLVRKYNPTPRTLSSSAWIHQDSSQPPLGWTSGLGPVGLKLAFSRWESWAQPVELYTYTITTDHVQTHRSNPHPLAQPINLFPSKTESTPPGTPNQHPTPSFPSKNKNTPPPYTPPIGCLTLGGGTYPPYPNSQRPEALPFSVSPEEATSFAKRRDHTTLLRETFLFYLLTVSL